jgi:hypothetical protein
MEDVFELDFDDALDALDAFVQQGSNEGARRCERIDDSALFGFLFDGPSSLVDADALFPSSPCSLQPTVPQQGWTLGSQPSSSYVFGAVGSSLAEAGDDGSNADVRRKQRKLEKDRRHARFFCAAQAPAGSEEALARFKRLHTLFCDCLVA